MLAAKDLTSNPAMQRRIESVIALIQQDGSPEEFGEVADFIDTILTDGDTGGRIETICCRWEQHVRRMKDIRWQDLKQPQYARE